jgi:hypothetical protein
MILSKNKPQKFKSNFYVLNFLDPLAMGMRLVGWLG